MLTALKSFGSKLLSLLTSHPILTALFVLVLVVVLGGLVLTGYRAIRGAIAKIPGVGETVAGALPAR